MSLLDRLTQDPSAVDDYQSQTPLWVSDMDNPTPGASTVIGDRDSRQARRWWA